VKPTLAWLRGVSAHSATLRWRNFSFVKRRVLAGLSPTLRGEGPKTENKIRTLHIRSRVSQPYYVFLVASVVFQLAYILHTPCFFAYSSCRRRPDRGLNRVSGHDLKFSSRPFHTRHTLVRSGLVGFIGYVRTEPIATKRLNLINSEMSGLRRSTKRRLRPEEDRPRRGSPPGRWEAPPLCQPQE
jgi:hypothetical protein